MSHETSAEDGGPIVPFHGQWVIGDESARPAPDFHEIPLSCAALFVHPALKAIPVRAAGQSVGWLLGTPISLSEARFVGGEFQAESGIDNLEEWIESEIYALGGSWIFVLDREGTARVYLDCAGSLSAVFERARKRIGATAQTLLGDKEYKARLLQDRISELEVRSEGWISADLTAHSGVYRLLANHYLDLKTFEAVRHWPLRSLDADLPVEVGAEGISRAAMAAIRATAAQPNTYMGLTGGYDTRVLLAMSRPIRDKLQFMTVAAPQSARDVYLARCLAREFNLDHRVLPLREANDAQQAAWDRRVGHVVSVNRRTHPTVWQLGNCYSLGGLGGEVGKGFLWLNAHEKTEIDAIGVVDRLKLPRQPYLVAAVGKWLCSLPPHMNALEILDLAYIELRMASWSYGCAYSNPIEMRIQPFNSRASYLSMLRTSPTARRENLLFPEIMAQNWPELLRIPINRYGDVRDKYENLIRGLRRPDAALRKARQLLRSW